MLIAASAALFLIMLATVGAAGYWVLLREPHTAAANAGNVPEDANPFRPNTPEWAAMLARIGSGLKQEEDQTGLRKRLTAAGVRWDGAVSAYYGAQVACPGILAAVLGGTAIAAGMPWDSLLGLAPLLLFLGYTLPDRYLRRRTTARRTAINRGLPDFLDLLVIAIESGMSMDHALVDTAHNLRRAHPTLADELLVFGRETNAGVSRARALRNLGDRSGEPEMRKLCQMLIQADRFGSSVAKVLRTQARYMRIRRRQSAEEKAHKTGVKLLFPIFFLIMPSVFLVTAGPAVIMLLTNFSRLAGM